MDIENFPFAEWLEKAVQALMVAHATGIAIEAMLPNGEMITMYWNLDPRDIDGMVGEMTLDAFMQRISKNTDMIKGMLEEDEQDDDE